MIGRARFSADMFCVLLVVDYEFQHTLAECIFD